MSAVPPAAGPLDWRDVPTYTERNLQAAVKAERERIIALAIAEAERQEAANFSVSDTIGGAALRDFADLLGGVTT